MPKKSGLLENGKSSGVRGAIAITAPHRRHGLLKIAGVSPAHPGSAPVSIRRGRCLGAPAPSPAPSSASCCAHAGEGAGGPRGVIPAAVDIDSSQPRRNGLDRHGKADAEGSTSTAAGITLPTPQLRKRAGGDARTPRQSAPSARAIEISALLALGRRRRLAAGGERCYSTTRRAASRSGRHSASVFSLRQIGSERADEKRTGRTVAPRVA